jgi:hypothetical protein
MASPVSSSSGPARQLRVLHVESRDALEGAPQLGMEMGSYSRHLPPFQPLALGAWVAIFLLGNLDCKLKCARMSWFVNRAQVRGEEVEQAAEATAAADSTFESTRGEGG